MAEIKALQGQATRRDVIKGTLKAGMYAAPVIAVGAIPFAASAVTGPTGVSFLVNGANATTVAFGSTFTVLGQNIPAGTTVYRVLLRTSAPNSGFFSYATGVVIGANKTYSETISTTAGNAIGNNGPGTYQSFLTTTLPTVGSSVSNGSLTPPVTITVTAQGAFVQPANAKANGAQEG